jgi:hypothetical protein
MQELAWFGWGSIWAFSVASSGDDPSSSADLRVVITITELGFLSPSADRIHTCCCLVSLLCLLDFMFQFSTSYIPLLWSVNCSNWLLIDSPLTTAQIPERLWYPGRGGRGPWAVVATSLKSYCCNPPITPVCKPSPSSIIHPPCLLAYLLACLFSFYCQSITHASFWPPPIHSFFLLRTLQQIDRFLSCPATNDDTENCIHRLHTTSARN